jgi:Zn-dependent protease
MPDSVSIVTLVIVLVLSALVVLVLPTRWRHAVTRTLVISAPPDRVWDLLVATWGKGSWRPEVVDIRRDSDDPELLTQICNYQGGRLVVVMRVLEMVPCSQLIMRCERIGENRLPLGPGAFSAVKLTPVEGGTRLAFREEGQFVSILSFLLFALAQRGSLGRLKNQAEGLDPEEAGRPRFGLSTAALVAGSIAAASAIAAIVGWRMGVLVFACLSVMEYGHALVLRYAGERPSFATLLPFVGGAVAMSKRQSTAYEEALRALSGPAVLTLLVIGLTVVSSAVGEGPMADNFRFAAGIAAVIVALFLLPFYPLNGGWLFNTLRTNLPARVFQLPGLALSTMLLFWSFHSGHVVLAGLAAGLIYELLVPLKSGIVEDDTLSSQNALMITGIYVTMNVIAYTTLTVFLLS